MKFTNFASIWPLATTAVTALTIPDSHPAAGFELERDIHKRDETRTNEFMTTYASEDILPTSKTVSVSTSTAATGTAVVAPPLSAVNPDLQPHTDGFVISTVENPAETEPPVLTSSIPVPTKLLQPVESLISSSERPEETGQTKEPEDSDLAKRGTNIFSAPIDTSAPLSMFKRVTDHPVPRKGISKTGPLQTNKFYTNLFMGNQTSPVFTFPYSLAWARGTGPAASWGMAISHVEARQRVFGPVQYNNAARYYLNPIGIQSIIISAKELGKNTVLTTEQGTQLYVKAALRKDSSSRPAIIFPIAQGMVFTTAYFSGTTPMIQSSVFFKSMTKVSQDPKTNVRKYNFVLEDGTTWRLYAYKTSGDPLDLKLVNNGLAQSTNGFTGYIQVAKDNAMPKSQAVLDNGCGVFPNGVDVEGSVSGSQGSYTLKFTRAGHSAGNLFMFALPHHVSSFDAATRANIKAYQLQTTTKGLATAVIGNSWTMTESSLPVDMGFAPRSTLGNRGLSTAAKNAISPIARLEVSQDMQAQTNLNSMYFAGKALAKFGTIVYVINNMLGDKALGQAGLNELKKAFSLFGSNKQQYPLYYESAWGGLVSSASYITGQSGFDFGNTYYNDHHFHYGYHILAAAYIGSMDSTWLAANKAYVNHLIRDFANPSAADPWYPQYRSFDWYHGHSWATGLFDQLDGKNQESSSEDIMAAYAVKMWGQVINDSNMVARANLQLAVMARSMQNNYYYTSDNTVQPNNFIGNKVAGILFENKIDHTTFFDPSIEAVQGIHMIPILPPSNFARTSKFVNEEWNAYFSNGRIDKIDNIWKGIIYGNYATVQPRLAWNFFNSTSFKSTWIDGGASRTWFLAYAGALGGV
ncbi:hypothetical protein NLU13_8298 [Sarocladium strictum]|uniref:glucan endo-1,3-beta-D-glucosidase n=1 Tax=Sarocladium strictum TaxID=5046 RepID=A0AA39GBF6_SARSR|nr:hypothetical protein NLU13_8298 [Sarocladium strictum]